MRTIRPVLCTILILIAFVILNDPFVKGLANTLSFFRIDNRVELVENTYKEELDRLRKTIADYELAQNGLAIYEGSSFVLSKIAIRDIYDIYDYAIINTSSKVSIDDPVLNENGLVGLISEVTKTTAKVSLLPGIAKMSVKVGEAYGILTEYDRENKVFVVHNIDNYKSIEVGEEVTTSGFQNVTAGLKIGSVSKVETKGIEKLVYVKPYVDFDSLNYLVVLAQ